MTLPDGWRTLARLLMGEPELAPPELIRAAGGDLDQARQLWRSLGFPPVANDERSFTRHDLDMLVAVRTLADQGTDFAQILQLARTMGRSLARVAEAQVAALHLTDRGADVATIGALVPDVERFVTYVWRRHLLAALFRADAADETLGGARQIVGFADLVGFTEVAQHLSEGELSELVERFEGIAYERIPELGGRIVKTIGDAVMFAVDEAHHAATIALALVDACAAEPLLPDLRVGLAVGATVAYEGDLFGQTVNLASRLVTLARPRTVLVSDELGAELAKDPAFTLHRLRPKLKGIGRVQAWALRPAAPRARRGSTAA
jgi:adenylate cyclase